MRRPRLPRLVLPRDAAATVLELFGIGCLAAFGYCIWAPAALLVVGVAAIFIAWTASRRR